MAKMTFHEQYCTYDKKKKMSKMLRRPFNSSPKHFYEDANKRYSKMDSGYEKCSLFEADWFAGGKKYYKIPSFYMDAFVATPLEIPSDKLRLPHDVFCIRLDENSKLSYTDENGLIQKVTTITVKKGKQTDIADMFNAFSSLMGKMKEEKGEEPDRRQVVNPIEFRLDFVCYNQDGTKHHTEFAKNERAQIAEQGGEDYARAVFDTVGDAPFSFCGRFEAIIGRTIEHCIKDVCKDVKTKGSDETDYHGTIPAEMINTCIRIICSVVFLATGSHKILEYDVLSKHLQAYRNAKTDREKKSIEQKAYARGKTGYIIGGATVRDGQLSIPNGMSYVDQMGEAGGREQMYQHIRGGHWHTVSYGKGHKEKRLEWFDLTVVNSDKPLKPV